MNLNKHTKQIFVTLASLFFLQSCTVFRTHIDEVCVSQFVDGYSNPQESRFSLPWKVGESYTLTQGNCTLESHSLTQKQHMSYDFKMPIGTPLHAIEGGRVVAVTESFRDNVDNGFSQANLIGIEHEGGILSWYGHLKYKGAIVEVDDNVSRGDVIGYSGNTGSSAYPHLHIYAQQLTKDCHDAEKHIARLERCPPIPISFFNASPGDTILKEWKTYTALPY